MLEWNMTASGMFSHANRFIEAYHTALQPLCRETGLPPMAVDILMYVANNPESSTAGDICRCRGLKPGIVSVHVDRRVCEGLLERQSAQGDRRKVRLVCTPGAAGLVERGRALQKAFGERLLEGVGEAELAAFRRCLAALERNIDSIRRDGI